MEIHIGKRIEKRAKELKIGTTELGKLINTSKQNVYGLFKRSSIDAKQLYELSKALKYNFFLLYDLSELEADNTIIKELEALRSENKNLKSEINSINEKYDLLQKINKLLEKDINRKK